MLLSLNTWTRSNVFLQQQKIQRSCDEFLPASDSFMEAFSTVNTWGMQSMGRVFRGASLGAAFPALSPLNYSDIPTEPIIYHLPLLGTFHHSSVRLENHLYCVLLQITEQKDRLQVNYYFILSSEEHRIGYAKIILFFVCYWQRVNFVRGQSILNLLI